jgi:hypothetical protein
LLDVAKCCEQSGFALPLKQVCPARNDAVHGNWARVLR